MSPPKWLWRSAQSGLPDLWFQSGLQPAQIDQLVTLTQTDPLIGQTTHDLERFKSVASITNWLQGSREVVVLLDPTDQLLGIVWVSQKPLPTLPVELADLNLSQYSLTFAIRLYGLARGKGLAQEFLHSALEACLQAGRFTGKLWLETKATNVSAIKTYQKLGFQQIAGPDAEQEILMVQP